MSAKAAELDSSITNSKVGLRAEDSLEASELLWPHCGGNQDLAHCGPRKEEVKDEGLSPFPG